MSKVLLLFILFMLLNPGKTFSQKSSFTFKNLTVEDGLPSNEVYFIFRDSKDYLWFATDQGVVKFDGSKIEVIKLPTTVIFKIFEDTKGRIWFFSQDCQFSYYKDGAVVPYKYNNVLKPISQDIIITNAFVNDKDEVKINSGLSFNFIISPQGVLTKLPVKYFVDTLNRFKFYFTGKDNLFAQCAEIAPGSKRFIFEIENNKSIKVTAPQSPDYFQQYSCLFYKDTYYFFAGHILFAFNLKGKVTTKVFDKTILAISPIKDKLYIGFLRGGAITVDLKLESILSDDHILKDFSVTSIVKDYEDGIWFSTLEKGIFYVKDSKLVSLNISEKISAPILRILNIKDSMLLIATHEGIYKYENSKINFVIPVENTQVNDLKLGSDNNIFFGGSGLRTNNSFRYNEFKTVNIIGKFKFTVIASASKIIPFNDTVQLFIQGYNLWSTKQNRFKTAYTPRFEAQFPFAPTFIFKDRSDKFWIGSNNNLWQLNTSDFSLNKMFDSSLDLKNGVITMIQVDDNISCVAIKNKGILLIRDNKIISSITENDGLVSNSVKKLFSFNGNIWVATSKGISIVQIVKRDPIQFKVINSEENIILKNENIKQIVSFQNAYLINTDNHLFYVRKLEEFLENKKSSLPFAIRSVTYAKQTITGATKLQIPYNQNSLVIKFGAITYKFKDEIVYYYRFSNIDSQWKVTAGNELLLQNMEPGDYKLQMKAKTQTDGRESSVAEMDILIENPWWKSGLFIISSMIFLLAGLIGIFKYRESDIQKKEIAKRKVLIEINELEQTALRSQMNPHFIFNCLSSIQQLVISNETESANNYLVLFSKLLRRTLEYSSFQYITLADEIKYLSDYLLMEELRLAKNLKFTFKIDKDIDPETCHIPNMLLQPIIENSIKHGIKQLTTLPGDLLIQFQKKESYLECTVKDNGVGLNYKTKIIESEKENKKYGLYAVNERLKLLSSANSSDLLNIKEVRDLGNNIIGTMVTLKIPYTITKI